MAKKETAKTIERTYNVPLRREFLKVPLYKRSKKASTALKQFLIKHMKSENVKINRDLNEEIWKHGMRNPPHHVKVTVTKNEKGEVFADLFGKKVKTPKKEEKKAKKKSLKDQVKETLQKKQ